MFLGDSLFIMGFVYSCSIKDCGSSLFLINGDAVKRHFEGGYFYESKK